MYTERVNARRRILHDGRNAPFQEVAFYLGEFCIHGIARRTSFQENHLAVDFADAFTLSGHCFHVNVLEHLAFFHTADSNYYTSGKTTELWGVLLPARNCYLSLEISPMKKWLFAVLLLVSLKASASHIVGGEFEIQWLTANTYRVTLIYYFDVLNNNFNGVPPEAMEPSITTAIFQKSNNAFIRTVVLQFVSRTAVSYTQPECSQGEIVTDKVVYNASIEMLPGEFFHPQGYYIVWERCCRNYTITNILSEVPAGPNSANSAGQSFYLEFPPVVKDGQPFINSTPRLFPPLNDFACPNKFYYADFAGVDDDGDSLVYSLVTPLSTHSTAATPPLQPAPFPEVKWRSPYSLNNIMGGMPDLKVSSKGFLTVTPSTQGLFVFAVKCEEFRDGVKIGEVRRDFQMLVVDRCSDAVAPSITGRVLTSDTYTPSLSISIPNSAVGDERCIEVKVTDPDINNPLDNFSERIQIRAIGLDFKGNASRILPAVTNAVLTPGSPDKTFKICFDECPFDVDGFSAVGIVAFDDACSLPLTDTMRVNLYLEPKPNSDPYFTTADVTESILEGDTTFTWEIEGIDDDNDPLEVTLVSNFLLPAAGMRLETVEQVDGSYRGLLRWTPNCEKVNFENIRDFTFGLALNDKECDLNEPDTMTFDLAVVLPPNTTPTLTINNDSQIKLEDNRAIATVGQEIKLTLRSTDPDMPRQNELELELISATGELDPEGFIFNPVSGSGNISSQFSWQPGCEIFTRGDSVNHYQFVFRTNDHSCYDPRDTTLTLDLTIRDIDAEFEKFLPPNIVTPNNDGKNDWFGLDDIEMNEAREYVPRLPKDNCAGRFLGIQIYNRWGKKIFESDQRNFRWYPRDQSAGLYFYTVQYTNRDYKGSVTLTF